MSTIVIGAGPAGLAAARKLTRYGEDVVVLEAQPHIGGRTRTVRDRLRHGQPADLGGSFIDIGQDKIIQACAELGLRLTPQMALFPPDPDGRLTAASPLRATLVVDGRRLDDAERDRVADEVRAALDAVPPSPTETIPAWAARACLSPVARRVFCSQAGFNPVHEAAQIPMSMLQPPHVGRVCWMLADGTDSLASALAGGLDIRLRQPVRLVRRARGGLVLETDTDRFTARDVVVATPVTPTLRIGFDPVLPEWKVNALLATPMAQGGKVIGQYTNGSEIVGRLGLSAVSDGPVSLIWARPPGPEDTVVVLGLVPDRGDGVLRDEARALDALDRLVGAATGLRAERLAGIAQDWTREQFAGGVVSALLGDFPRLPSLLAQAVGPVHFAGEHTAEMWATGMDGALRSGERAADEVFQRRRQRASNTAAVR
ncbi:FAD-dependent oxidoreductase [Actinomadura sp. KC216]|uniref:flavin monoamine oxidase family protein n=1 Tax=Actinomadura sp. KC216 TaxID=2530370 RepID=UPI0010493D93|nr:NAD(P)/FAD-dependent oxidoreductase [Actinomadura sp. KC216]TDB88729.1 FAD-dependent oxidoreductase [Actinomadura sp. KC216]